MKVTAINTAPTDIPLELGLRVVGRREARPFQGDHRSVPRRRSRGTRWISVAHLSASTDEFIASRLIGMDSLDLAAAERLCGLERRSTRNIDDDSLTRAFGGVEMCCGTSRLRRGMSRSHSCSRWCHG